MGGATLHPGAWLLWGVAASLPPLLGRNPVALGTLLLVVLGVRGAWAGAGRETPRLASWATLARWAILFAVTGALFNLLTVPVGDHVLVEVPPAIPIVGDVLTLNALLYGILSGLALVCLVLIGATLGMVLDWAALLRLMPERLTALAVAGTVAFTFVPQTVVAFREIHEAQIARGFRLRGARDLQPLLVPLLAGGLERSVTLAEALEARAFGTPPPGEPDTTPGWRAILLAVGLAAGATAGYLLTSGRAAPAGLCALLAAAALLPAAGARRRHVHRTRYRPSPWRRADLLVATGALLAIGTALVALGRHPAALRYEPYPALTVPAVDLLLLVGLATLLLPIWMAPGAARAESQAAGGQA